jgi:2-dehydropantoate 2-reductase
MKITIYGAGAIGGYLAVQLALQDHQVSVVARGAQLEAIQTRGLTLRIHDEERTARVDATDDPSKLGPQDYVIVALKAHSAPLVVDLMQPLLGPDTAVVTAMNGVPWWYFYALDCPWRDHILQSVDPDGRQWHGIGPERAIGCVVYPATEVVEPGIIQHVSGDRFTLGEPNGEKTERVRALSQAMIAAGFKAPVRAIRDEIWVKLWGNLSFNPISVLTRATLDAITGDPSTRDVSRRMMLEAQEIGTKLGVRFAIDVDQRIEGAAKVGAHKTSMLQDLERGRPMEVDALLGAVQELGRITDTATPTIDTVLALVKLLARNV